MVSFSSVKQNVRRSVLGLLLPMCCVFGSTTGFAQQYQEPKFLTNETTANDYWPGFTRDGAHVFYSQQEPREKWKLMQIPVTGGPPEVLYKGEVGATRGNLAADGSIAFTGIRQGGPAELWVRAGSGATQQVKIQHMPGNPSYPSWYPDLKSVAMVAYQGNRGGNLVRVNVSSGTWETLTDSAAIRCGMPSVSPDGNSIVFAGQRPDPSGLYDQTKNNIWVRYADGTLKQLSPGQGRAPVWSPDGKWVAYESTEGSRSGKYAIYIIAADGSKNRQVTDFKWDANHPVFSADGRSIVLSAHHPDHPERTSIAVISIQL